jgi:hypothetical protein
MKKIEFKKIEFYFFVSLTFLNLIPVLSFRFFPTLDGPFHLYSLTHGDSFHIGKSGTFRDFLYFNHTIFPRISFLLLSFLKYLFPVWLCDKIFLVLCLTTLPFVFRKLIKTISPANFSFCYFIFPFTYSFVLYLGFYDFYIGLIIMLLVIHYFLQNISHLSGPKLMIFVGLIMLAYFAHVFVFIILLMILMVLAASSLMKNNSLKNLLQVSKSKIILLIIILLILLLISYLLFLNFTTADKDYLVYSELASGIKNLRPLICFSWEKEEMFTKKIFYLIFALVVIAVYNKFTRRISLVMTSKNPFLLFFKRFTPNDTWLLISVLIFVLYFYMADQYDQAGFVSLRLCTMFFLFLSIWLAIQVFPIWLRVISILTILVCHFQLMRVRMETTGYLSAVATEINEAGKLVQENKTVMDFDFSDNWIMGHFSGYLAIDRRIKVVDGTFENKISPPAIDYILMRGDVFSKNDTISKVIIRNITEHYTLIPCNSSRFKLYTKKQ